VRRLRLETAASRLLAQPPQTTLTIALEVGFGSAEVFTRAFKAHFCVTPSAWRSGAWQSWAEQRRVQLSKIHQALRKPDQALVQTFREDERAWQSCHAAHQEGENAMNVEIKTLPETRVAYMRHVGPYGDPGIGRTWDRFSAWCASKGLFARRLPFFGLSHDSPDITAPDKCRYDACVEIDSGFRPEGEVGVQTLPCGLYACTAFEGPPEAMHQAWSRLCGQWLPDSGYQADDRPAVEAYGPQLDVDPKTGAFRCMICLPVKPL